MDALRRGSHGRERNGSSIAVHDDRRLSIDFDPCQGQTLPEVRSVTRNDLGNTLTTNDWYSRRAHDPAAIRIRDNVLREEIFQCSDVSCLGGVNKRSQKAPLLVGTDGSLPPIGDMFAGTGNYLAGVCFLYLQDVCDLAVRVVERFTQNICGPLCRRELLKEHQDGEFQRFGALRTQGGVGGCVHGFWQPFSDVSFATRTGRLDKIDA